MRALLLSDRVGQDNGLIALCFKNAAWDAMGRDSTNDHEPQDLTKPEGAHQESILGRYRQLIPGRALQTWFLLVRGCVVGGVESSSVTASQTPASNCHAERGLGRARLGKREASKLGNQDSSLNEGDRPS